MESVLATFEANLKQVETTALNPLTIFRRNADPLAGTSLKQFLKMHTSSNAKSDVYVTGHSKGGALSSTLALWLADTQGQQPDVSEEWDRDSKAAVHCYRSPGRRGKRGIRGTLGRDLERLPACLEQKRRRSARLRPDELTALSTLYGLRVGEGSSRWSHQEGADAVRPLDYKQVSGSGIELDGELLPSLPLPLQMIHQHLDSYLEKFGLIGEMTAGSLLAPVL